MNAPRIQRCALAVLCALALLGTSCGSGSDAGGDADSATASGEETSSGASGSSPSTTRESPIADLLGVPVGNDDAAEQWFVEVQREAERKTSECMLAQGFEYKPVDFGGAADLATTDFESREFAETYGFGVSSNPFGELVEEETFEDPNAEYVASLSEGERDAYNTALNGEAPDLDSSEDGEPFLPGGCQGEAFEEVFSFVAVFEEFGDELETLEEAYEADSRIVEAQAAWATCMSDAGYTYAGTDAARADFEDRYNTIVASPDAFEPAEIDDENAANPFAFGPGKLTPEYQVRVDELAIEERAVALASFDCEEPHRQLLLDVQVEYEQGFVDQNGAAIRELMDN